VYAQRLDTSINTKNMTAMESFVELIELHVAAIGSVAVSGSRGGQAPSPYVKC